MNVEGMADYINADSLAFISIDGLYRALGDTRDATAAAALRCLLHRRISDAPDRLPRKTTPDRPCLWSPRASRYTPPSCPIRNRCPASSRLSPAPAAASAPRPPKRLPRAARTSSSSRARAKALEEVEDRIHEAGGNATIAPLDLTDGESIARLSAAVAERWGQLDMLVLNAAMLGSLTPVEHIDPKEYARVLTLNVGSNQALIAAFDPLLRKAERADVVGSHVERRP